MSHLFNYNTITSELKKETRTLEVGLPADFSTEMIFELESLLSWCTEKIEISSILFKPTKEFFPSYINESNLSEMSPGKFQKLIHKLRKLIYSMHYLPQTIIMDYSSGCFGLGAEFLLGADIRVGMFRSTIHWNHLNLGITPMCGGTTLLGTVIGQGKAKNWVLTGKKISATEAFDSGFMGLSYQVPSEIKYLLRNIHSQSQVSRIQAKRAFLETVRATHNAFKDYDQKIGEACLTTEDFRKWSSKGMSKDAFLSPLELGKSLETNQIN